MKASFKQYYLQFKQAAGTSRGVLHQKETYIISIQNGTKLGVGECNLFRGLSCDDVPQYEEKLQWVCDHIHLSKEELLQELIDYPSIAFGLEQAFCNLNQEKNIYFPSEFTLGNKPITINGLIWMGDISFMKSQIEEKLSLGFSCIKLKIGVHWEEEHKILQQLRDNFPKEQLELRVDANGAFTPQEAQKVLHQLAALEVHSIEQPISAGQWQDISLLCSETPTPIALDEELIGIQAIDLKKELLDIIQPQYIILKPALVGGFRRSEEWIALAKERNIGWWITSALESNIGLNALAQWTYTLQNPMPQGLGTGGLFTNNFPSPLVLKGDELYFSPE